MPRTKAVLLIAGLGLFGCNSASVSPKIDNLVEQQERSRNTDCSYKVFSPKNYPLGIIKIVAGDAINDSNNAVVGSVLAKCVEGKNNEHIICGVVARRNSVGYIDNAKRFFGVYFLDKEATDAFQLKALGSSADKLCRQNAL